MAKTILTGLSWQQDKYQVILFKLYEALLQQNGGNLFLRNICGRLFKEMFQFEQNIVLHED